jgi:hypothetical protein
MAAEVLEHRLCLSAITSLQLSNDTDENGDNITTDASIVGTVTSNGSTNGVEVEIDLDGDGLADSWTFANASGSFTYDPAGYVNYGPVTIKARVIEWDDVTTEYLYCDWATITFS